MNITEISIEQYKKMSDEEKRTFYKKINSDLDFEKAVRLRKTKNMKSEGFKQPNGRLTFIDELKRTDKKVTNFYYLCICDCGNWTILTNRHFDTETSISCGCFRKEQSIKICKKLGKSQYIDMTNQEFGDLIVIEKTEHRVHESIIWKCKCKNCGLEQYVDGYMLRSGKRFFCEYCNTNKSIGERKIKQLLIDNNIDFELEKTFDTCRFKDSNYLARFDFYVDNRYLIEFDGIQHFKPERFSRKVTEKEALTNLLINKQHDNFKDEWCLSNNIPLIRIPYTYIQDLTLQDLIPETSKWLVI